MICIFCGYSRTAVTNSRPQDKQLRIWRRRKCLECQNVFTTNETVDDSDILVKNKDDQTIAFNAGKLAASIYASFAHDIDQGSSASQWLAASVKYSLIASFSIKQKQIKTSDIAEATHKALTRFDNVAAVQYAARHQLINKR